MTERCHDPADLVDLAGLPPGDPRRGHLETCPRCRGLAEAQGLFLEPGDTSDLPDLAAADAELAARLETALAAEPARTIRPERRRAPWYALAAALALCALGVATADLLDLRLGGGPRVGERIRGGATADLLVTADDGVLHGAWADAPTADSYVLELLDADLTTIDRREVAGPEFTQPIADLPPGAAYCRLAAVSSGDVLARSGLVAFDPAGEVR
jgi:hypothetical protein